MKFFLPKKYIYLLIFLILVFLFIGALELSFMAFLALAFLLTITRIKIHSYQEDMAFKENIFFSPVNGSIQEIADRTITITVPWWSNYGVYLPLKSEFETISLNEGKDHFRFFSLSRNLDAYSSVNISCSSGKDLFEMTFVKCHLGLWPTFHVMPGDRGKSLVTIGNLCLGGTVVVKLPKDYESNLDKGARVIVGETILASKC